MASGIPGVPKSHEKTKTQMIYVTTQENVENLRFYCCLVTLMLSRGAVLHNA